MKKTSTPKSITELKVGDTFKMLGDGHKVVTAKIIGVSNSKKTIIVEWYERFFIFFKYRKTTAINRHNEHDPGILFYLSLNS